MPPKILSILSRSFRRETWHCSADIQGPLSVNLPELPIRNAEEFEVGNGTNYQCPPIVLLIFTRSEKHFGPNGIRSQTKLQKIHPAKLAPQDVPFKTPMTNCDAIPLCSPLYDNLHTYNNSIRISTSGHLRRH